MKLIYFNTEHARSVVNITVLSRSIILHTLKGIALLRGGHDVKIFYDIITAYFESLPLYKLISRSMPKDWDRNREGKAALTSSRGIFK